MHLRGCMTTQNSSLRSTATSASAGIIPPSVVHKSKKQATSKLIGFAILRSTQEIPAECAFERFVAEHAIPEQLWPNSDELRAWCKRNAASRYVPENLLAAFNISINDKLSFIHVEGR
jgi:hypothetical protein